MTVIAPAPDGPTIEHFTATDEFAAVQAAQSAVSAHLAAMVPHVLAVTRAEGALNDALVPLARRAAVVFPDSDDPQADAFVELLRFAGDGPRYEGLCLEGAISSVLGHGGPIALELITRIADTLGAPS